MSDWQGTLKAGGYVVVIGFSMFFLLYKTFPYVFTSESEEVVTIRVPVSVKRTRPVYEDGGYQTMRDVVETAYREEVISVKKSQKDLDWAQEHFVTVIAFAFTFYVIVTMFWWAYDSKRNGRDSKRYIDNEQRVKDITKLSVGVLVGLLFNSEPNLPESFQAVDASPYQSPTPAWRSTPEPLNNMTPGSTPSAAPYDEPAITVPQRNSQYSEPQ